MKINYNFYKWKPSDYNYNLVKVVAPYEYLSMIFEGTESSNYIKNLIDGINSVVNGDANAFFSIENQNGFIGYAFAPNSTEKEFPNGGFQVFDFFSLDENGETQLKFVLELSEVLKLLQDFYNFLLEDIK